VDDKGDVSDFIVSNNIGLFLNEDNFLEIEKEIISQKQGNNVSKFSMPNYDYLFVTETLKSFLNQP